ncbi:2-amino-4-hydroxy-6-hydroxymethyldihydropteridine diphosphokinase [Snodgrassella alvi]|jgi:2-amino-4-hydroxy-6-hydroxymethyldihydropteridine diphosphokinase|uniref:2-amino-4-hydroxy-6-hydroxymethyldihydropteridine pyrophosphokinase n=1 Tax=Snodgrassella alvi TaxID=1196083 RepID=A0A855FNG0_9NEIS|nr:2-amino-4-hydroxy-6-hydroxymethyldihydropteridine diphosphokinase [Snodgrassella alvi]PIT49521.1 2-amino-4-hydroxy-6-hydroxymethyldihydropteridine diphosphokinase [Snodgrassella alvi]PIT60946.1 2-amino-4-hydroxy-6-hydroxymethyldihydropteridine diphosphokinase [Snodgrassella alvi]
MNTVTAVIALGSNLENPRQQVETAMAALNQIKGVRVKAISPLYTTKPVGLTDQPDFVNAVVLVHTSLSAPELLGALQELENQRGRIRDVPNGPRIIDLDLIDYHHQTINEADLVLPHPRAHERAFVMVPLAAIAPYYVIGTYGSASALAAKLLKAEPDAVTIIADVQD